MPISFVLFHKLILVSASSPFLSVCLSFHFLFSFFLSPFLYYFSPFFVSPSPSLSWFLFTFLSLIPFPGFIWFLILSLLYSPIFFCLAPSPYFSFSFLKPSFFIFLRPSLLRNSDYSLMNRIWSSLLLYPLRLGLRGLWWRSNWFLNLSTKVSDFKMFSRTCLSYSWIFSQFSAFTN